LVWEHWTEDRYPLPQERDSKGLRKGFRRVSESWTLENAVETREQCLARFQKQLDRIRETASWSEQDTKPGERIQFKMVPVIREISREMYMFRDIQKSDGTQERSSVVIEAWCLAVGLGPKTIADR